MIEIQRICVEENITISDGIKKLNEGGEKLLLVTKDQSLVGIITDGDIRRWILKKGSFEKSVDQLMHKNPKTVRQGEMQKAKSMMLEMHLEAIPVVDNDNIPRDVIFWRDIVESDQKKYEQIDIPVVIMAGGMGTRLYPYTKVLPKPLIPIGSMTILERIIESFTKNGCTEFWLTLNYKKNLIKAYMDEKEKSYQVQYVEENNFLGTCGSIKLLQDKISRTFFMSNCDVLHDIDYADLLRYHKKNKNEITVVTSLKHLQIPYGVIELGDCGTIRNLQEKPSFTYSISTGIYVMEPSVMEDIPRDQVYHITDLMNKLLNERRKVGAYSITEKCWQDMGEFDEMKHMLAKY